MTFGEIVKDLLADIDLSQKEFAEILRIAPSTLGNYLQDKREPDFSTLIEIADFFLVTIDFLLDHRVDYTNNFFEDDLLHIFRSQTTDQQEIFLEYGKLITKQNYRKEGLNKMQVANPDTQYKDKV